MEIVGTGSSHWPWGCLVHRLAGLLRCCSRTCQESGPSGAGESCSRGCATGGALLQNCQRCGASRRCWTLGAARAWGRRHCPAAGSCRTRTQDPGATLSSCDVSLEPSIDQALMPVGKGKMFQSPIPIFTEQSKRVNLELESKKLITSTL